MGDPTMTRVKDIDGVIDYPFTKHKSMPMDLFLVSRCRFVLGSSSGFGTTFAPAFGSPLLVANESIAPVSTVQLPYDNNIFMPRRMVEQKSGRILSLREMFHASVPNQDNAQMYEASGYRWESNTPEDILEATKEMLHLVETNSFGLPRTKEQEQFHNYRLEALESLWMSSERRWDVSFSELHKPESRVSATFAARYFSEEVAYSNLSASA